MATLMEQLHSRLMHDRRLAQQAGAKPWFLECADDDHTVIKAVLDDELDSLTSSEISSAHARHIAHYHPQAVIRQIDTWIAILPLLNKKALKKLAAFYGVTEQPVSAPGREEPLLLW